MNAVAIKTPEPKYLNKFIVQEGIPSLFILVESIGKSTPINDVNKITKIAPILIPISPLLELSASPHKSVIVELSD